MPRVSLACHRTTPCEAVRRIDVDLTLSSARMLTLQYVLEGDVGLLQIPEVGVSRRVDKLWQHTCFEAFIAAQDGAGYDELNFAPSGEWAMYRFHGYREGMTVVEAAGPDISTRCDAQRLVLEAAVDLKALHGLGNLAELRLALSAVIEESTGRLSYWALAHPSSQPDFHHADSFTLVLDQPGTPT
jgi:hypothetical protein